MDKDTEGNRKVRYKGIYAQKTMLGRRGRRLVLGVVVMSGAS
jgi:hypothetical protein